MHTGRQADNVLDVFQARFEAAFEPADQRVRIAAPHRERADHRVVGAHQGFGRIGRDALAAGGFHVGRDVIAIARIVLRVDQIEIATDFQPETIALDARLDHVGTADQDRFGDAFLDDHLHGAQDPLVLALGVDHPFGVRLRLREQRLHDEAGAEHEARQRFRVSLEILQRGLRDARIHGGLRHRGSDAQDQPGIERARNQRLLAERMRLAAVSAGHHFGRRFACETRDRLHGRSLHLLVDGGRAHIERAAEDVGEAQDVVDLVRIIRPAGADHRVRTRGLCLFGHDFRIRIGERHDERLGRHSGQELRLQNAARRDAEEDIGIVDDVGQRARIGLLRIGRFPAVHEFVAPVMDDAFDVGDPDVFTPRAERHEEVEAGERRRPCPGGRRSSHPRCACLPVRARSSPPRRR